MLRIDGHETDCEMKVLKIWTKAASVNICKTPQLSERKVSETKTHG